MDYQSRAKDLVCNANKKPWTFAHIADALGVMYSGKQNVLMRDNGLDLQQNKERKGESASFPPAIKRVLSSSTVFPFIPEVNECIEERNSDASIVEVEKELLWSWKALHSKPNFKTCVRKKVAEQPVGTMPSDIKSQVEEREAVNQSVNPDAKACVKQNGFEQFDSNLVSKRSDGNSLNTNVQETGHVQFGSNDLLKRSEGNSGNSGIVQSRYAQEYDKDNLSISSGKFSAKAIRQRKPINEEVENAWNFDLVSDHLPGLISESHLFSLGLLPSQTHLTGGKSGLWKITMSKIPLVPIHNGLNTVSPIIRVEDIEKGNNIQLLKKKRNSLTAKRRKIYQNRIMKQLLCGAFAGVVSRTAVAPLELIKTHLITAHGLRGANKSAFMICKEIVERSGWQGLFRGNLVNCIRVAPSKAVELYVFETVKKCFDKEGHPFKNAASIFAGGAAGMAGTITTYPLELLRTRISVQPELYSGLFHAIQKIARDEGLLAFYSGLTPSLVGVFPYAATSYFVYDALRSAYRRTMKVQSIPMLPTLTFGAISAATSSAVTYPLEVARRQMQLCLADPAMRKSSLGVIKFIYNREGFFALYRGLGTTWLKLIPAAGISFVCYEAARRAFLIDDASVVKLEEHDMESAE